MKILTDRGIVTDEQTVDVGKATLMWALRKARSEYVRVAHINGHHPGPDWECWAEFEALAEYLPEGDR